MKYTLLKKLQNQFKEKIGQYQHHKFLTIYRTVKCWIEQSGGRSRTYCPLRHDSITQIESVTTAICDNKLLNAW